jgi:hypothetical protein
LLSGQAIPCMPPGKLHLLLKPAQFLWLKVA